MLLIITQLNHNIHISHIDNSTIETGKWKTKMSAQ